MNDADNERMLDAQHSCDPTDPSLLTLAQATEYIGISPSAFWFGIRQGYWAGPVTPDPAMWDRKDLDAVIDQLSRMPTNWREAPGHLA